MKKVILALIATAGIVGGASAQTINSPYVGVGAVWSEHRYNLNNDVTSNDRKSDEWGGKVYGGVQFNPMFGAEVGYTDFGKSNYSYNVAGVPGRVEADASSFYLAGTARYPVAEKINVIGKLGVAHNKNDVEATGVAAGYNGDSSRNAVYASLGAEYAINEKVSLSLEYEHYGKNDIDVGRRKGAVSLGARYNF